MPLLNNDEIDPESLDDFLLNSILEIDSDIRETLKKINDINGKIRQVNIEMKKVEDELQRLVSDTSQSAEDAESTNETGLDFELSKNTLTNTPNCSNVTKFLGSPSVANNSLLIESLGGIL